MTEDIPSQAQDGRAQVGKEARKEKRGSAWYNSRRKARKKSKQERRQDKKKLNVY